MDEVLTATKEPGSKEWRSFWILIAIQIQNAFNEKAAQIILIPLAVWLAESQNSQSHMEYYLGAVVVLPYLLFAPFVGWLADCFCKTRIIQGMAFLQIVVMGAMWYFLIHHNMAAALALFCVFAIQATILSPARKGVIKDMIGSKQLGFASGIVEVAGIFAILAAQISIFFWFDSILQKSGDGWHSAAFPTLMLMLAAIPVAFVSLVLPSYAIGEKRRFKVSLFYEHFLQLKFLWKDRNIRLSEIGISYFWFLASLLTLVTIQISKMEAGPDGSGMGTKNGILTVYLSCGVIAGGIIGSILCRKKIELGLIPFGAIGITLGCIYMACFEPMTIPSNIGFSLLGLFAALFLVPLNAYLQDKCDPKNRGNILAAANLMDMLMALIAVFVQFVLGILFPDIQGQFIILAILSLGITIVSLRLIPREFVRMVGLWIMHLCYKPRIIKKQEFPDEEGVLIISNHVTYADALFLSMITPRPIRFIVAEEFVTMKFLGWLLELFNCLPISSKKPKEAISKSIQSLKNGEVVCIFPEGQLTRTGTLCAARKGLELLARKSKAKVIPVYMDGLWGSIFSFSGNRFFSKFPRHLPGRFTAAIGSPLSAEETNPTVAINVLRKLSAECLENNTHRGIDKILKKLEQIGSKEFIHLPKSTITGEMIASLLVNKTTGDLPEPASAWMSLLLKYAADEEQLNKLWINAQQLERVNSIQPQEIMLTSVGYDEPQEIVISILWPILTSTPIYLLTDNMVNIPSPIKQISGGAYVRKQLYHLIPERRVPFYDFSNQPDLALPNTNWKPCYCTPQGTVLSMSMAKSVYKLDDGTVQLGMRARTRGRLLPGFYLRDNNQSNIICSPVLTQDYSLPENVYLDESGFIAEFQ